MPIDPYLKAELERDEGRRLTAYRDSLGYWTIGVGHLLGGSPRMSSITERECEALLGCDIEDAEKVARDLFAGFDDLDPVRQRVLINMAFNLGNRLAQFKRFRVAVAEKRWQDAATSMEDSLWYSQVKARAVRLKDAILTGVMP
jgi:lysozyme